MSGGGGLILEGNTPVKNIPDIFEKKNETKWKLREKKRDAKKNGERERRERKPVGEFFGSQWKSFRNILQDGNCSGFQQATKKKKRKG